MNIPTYFNVVPRKDARDLRTIRQKLDTDKYDSVEAFEADIELMVHNAVKFNGEDSDVGYLALTLRDKCRELLTSGKVAVNKKRKEGDKGTPQPAKRVKLV